MPRFYVPRPVISEEQMSIAGSEAHHIQGVLRLKLGDRITIFDGTGHFFECEIIHENRQTVTVRILESLTHTHESSWPLIMGQSLVKGDKMDFIVQKATEMGVSSIIPFVSARSVSRLEGPRMEKRLARWRRIAVESSKQCGRMVPLVVERVVSFHDALQWRTGRAGRIVLWEKAKDRLKSLLRGNTMDHARMHGMLFLVGPEGGFSETEIKQAEKAHFKPASLGSRILRVETAGLTFISIVQYELGDMG